MEHVTATKRRVAALLNVMPLGRGYIYLRQEGKASKIVGFWGF